MTKRRRPTKDTGELGRQCDGKYRRDKIAKNSTGKDMTKHKRVIKGKPKSKPSGNKKIPIDYALIRECEVLAGNGLTHEHMCYYFKLKPATWHRMINESKELHDAIHGGRARMVNEIAALLVKKAREGNVTAMIFYLKARGRFHDWVPEEGDPERPAKASFTIKTTDPVEAARIYQQVMTGS